MDGVRESHGRIRWLYVIADGLAISDPVPVDAVSRCRLDRTQGEALWKSSSSPIKT